MLKYFIIATSLFLMIIEIVTVLFMLTGLSEEKARFQVISLLTGSGFTTKESELITQHPTRRKLAQFLMVLGYVGFLTETSFLVNLIRSSITLQSILTMLIFFFVIWLIVKNKILLSSLDGLIEKIVLSTSTHKKSPGRMYKLITRAKGYGIYNIVLSEDSPLIGVSLKDSNLKPNGIIILNIDKGNEFIGFARRNYVLEPGDNILLYGKIEQVVRTFHLDQNNKNT